MTDKNSDKNTYEVILVGSAQMDLLVYPFDRKDTDAVTYQVDEMTWSIGGDAINEATIISRLGHRVKLVSCFGDDMMGRMIIDHCDKNGIDTDFLKLDKDKVTGVSIGLVEKSGERVFINNKSGSVWTFEPSDIDLNEIRDAKIMCFASIFSNPMLDGKFALDLFKCAKEEGMLVCADIVSPKNEETLDDIRDILPYIDYFFPNYIEGKKMTGRSDIYEIADGLLNLGIKNVILKIGADGCLVKNKNGSFIVPAYKDADCVDTTGAGDNFAAGFISGLLEGKDLKECAELANATASLAIETMGATGGVKGRDQVDERLSALLSAFI